MGLDEHAWKEFIDDALSLAATVVSAGDQAAAVPLAQETADRPRLGMEFLTALVEEAEADEALLVLQRLLRLAERRNPMHAHVSQHGGPPSDAEVAAVLHGGPPSDPEAGTSPTAASERDIVERNPAAAAAGTYREWCANRVAAGELLILRRSLAILAELFQSADNAVEGDSQSFEESASDDSEVEEANSGQKRKRV